MANLDQLGLPDGSTYNFKDNTQERSDHRHYESDRVPLVHKLYESTSYYATTASDYATSTWYFMSVKPDEWYKPWRVKFKVHSYCPAHTDTNSYTWSTICGRADSLIYANWNEKYNTAHYYIAAYPLKQAGFNAGYGHALGISIINGTGYTNSGYYRTFEIDYYDCENCTVTILDTPVKWADWTGTGTTNYGNLSAYDATNRGLRETGDDNTIVNDRINYIAAKTGSKGIWAGSLFMEDEFGTYQNICTASDGTVTSSNRTTATTKIANTNGFKVGSPIWYTSTSYDANTNISGSAQTFTAFSDLFDTRYSFNTTLTANFLTPYKPLYLVGTINASDGLFYLDPVWWTQTPNDTSKIYVLVGGVYDSTTSNCRATLYEQNKWFRYDGTNLIEIINDVIVCKATDPAAIATFSDAADGVIFKSLNIEIKPKQASGTPTPSNPLPISGTDTVIVTQTGKNLVADTIDGYTVSSNGSMASSGQVNSLALAPIKAGVQYTITTDDVTGFVGGYFTEKPTITSTTYNNSRVVSNNKTFTAPITGWVAFRMSYQYATPQLEVGSTATTYEAYTATTKTVSLPETVYGGEVDVIGGSGESTHEIIDLGDLSWTYTSGDHSRMTATLTGSKGAPSGQTFKGACSIYKPAPYNSIYNHTEDKIIGISDTGTVWVYDSDYTDADVFKTAVTGQKLCYELATPTQITLANPIDLTAQAGVNNVFGDTDGNTSVEYYTDTPIVYAIDDISKKNNTDTTYSLTQDPLDGHTITLTPSEGAAQTITIPDNNTTYTFANGTNGFTVTPAGGSAQTVTVTPSITNNVTGSGTSGYIAKFNGTNTITNGPAFGSATTTYLRNDGTWATPANTDTNVTQTATTTNADYEVLFSGSANNTTATEGARKNSNLKFNPSTGQLTGTRFVGATRESYLEWGGKNISGNITPIGMAVSDEHNANRLAFVSGDAYEMEYSSDGGTTWTDYGFTEAEKKNFGTATLNIPIGRPDGSTEVTTQSRTRITIHANNEDGSVRYFYTDPRKLLIRMQTAGGVSVLIETRTGSGSWTTFNEYGVSGNSGWNDIPLILSTLGGYVAQTSNYWHLRLTFKVTSVHTTYPKSASILSIRLYGTNSWLTASNMGNNGHIYSYDINQNATFPANLKMNGSKQVTCLSSTPTSGQVVVADGTGGGLKTTGYTIATSVPSGAVFTDQNVNQADGASSNNDYKLLFEDTSGSGNVVSGTRKTQYLVYNPSTRKLKIGITNPNEYGTLETDDITAQQINGVSLGNSPKFTDQAVQQLSGGNNVDYQVLFEDTSGSGEVTSGTRKHSGLVYNPNTSTLTSTNMSATSISSTSLAATTITGSTLNGQTIPAAPVFTDQAVQQLEGGNNTAYELLYEDTASSGDTTSGTRKSQNLTYNPVSNTLTLAGKVDCTSMSVTTPTYTLNKTSGTWNVGSVSAKRTGNVVQMTIIVKGTGTGVTCGTDGFAGSLSGTGPAPAQDMTLVSYTGNFTIVGYIDTSRKIWIRPIGSGTYTAGNNSSIQVDGMFICE